MRGETLPRVDDFYNAIALAREILPSRDPQQLSHDAGAQLIQSLQGDKLRINFFNREVDISYPEGIVEYREGSDKLSPQEQGLILHYLLGVRCIPLSDSLITFREIPSGEFYYQAFTKRAQIPLVDTFGEDTEGFLRAGKLLGGQEAGVGDVSLTIVPLPKIPITFVLWRGDDEFPPEGTILFDPSIEHFLAGEDIAFLAANVVYKLMAKRK